VMVAPALQTEGKQLQRDQAVGMGATAAAAAAPGPDVSNGHTPAADPALVE
jgi:IMP dehydrogenase